MGGYISSVLTLRIPGKDLFDPFIEDKELLDFVKVMIRENVILMDHSVFGVPPEKLKEMSNRIVADFDSQILEEDRKLWNSLIDRNQKEKTKKEK